VVATTTAAAISISFFLYYVLLFFFCLLNPYDLCVNLYVRSRTKLAFNSSSFLFTTETKTIGFFLFLLEHAQLTLFFFSLQIYHLMSL